MELKLLKNRLLRRRLRLLIEPYGIEISFERLLNHTFVRLLIEPYGIEIDFLSQFLARRTHLLIEPYGIEIIITDKICEALENF